MSAPSPTGSSLQDAQTLFGAFAKSQWRTLDLRVEGLEFYVSRAAAAVRRAAILPADIPSPPVSTAAGLTRRLTTDRLGTVICCAEASEILGAGKAYATLEILGEPFELTAETDCEVVKVLVAPGQLVEYGAAIVEVCLTPGD